MAFDDGRILSELTEAMEAARPVALATVVETRRSVPRRAGTKMLIFDDGSYTGTVGGGAMESKVIAESVSALTDGRSRLLEYTLLDPERGDPGVCGGEVKIYVEPFMPPHTVFVIGAGHVGKAVVQLAGWLGYHTVVTDDRAELATTDEMPEADELLPGSVEDALAAHPVTADTSIIVVSRNPAIDAAAIPLLLDTPARYIGVMGSNRRWQTTRKSLEAAGIPSDRLDRIHSPIGIELNAETLEEIAVSIMAEVIAVTRAGAHEDPAAGR